MMTIMDRSIATDTVTSVTNLGHVGATPETQVKYINVGEASSTGFVWSMPAPFRREFCNLADWWHEATDASSSPDEKANCEAYQRIIGVESGF